LILTIIVLFSPYIEQYISIPFLQYIIFGITTILFLLGLFSHIKINKIFPVILISILYAAAVAAFVYTFFSNTFETTIFYNTTNFFITFLLFIHYLELKESAENKLFFKKITTFLPRKATLYQHETISETDAEKLKKGDTFIVKSGQTVPADGIIIKGTGKLNEGIITGSNDLVVKSIGEEAMAGSINVHGEILVKATRVAENITLKKIIEYNKISLKNTPKIKSKLSQLEKFLQIGSIPLSIIIFLATWYISKNVYLGFKLGGGLFILLNPLFFKLIYNTIYTSSVIEGVKRGISIKSGKVMKHLSKINHFIFNKTGIITHGIPEITNIIPKEGFNIKRFLILIGSLEKLSTHQFAQSIVRYCEENKITFKKVFNFKEIEGNGIMGTVDGEEIIAGNFKLMEKSNVNLHKELMHKAEIMAQNLKTPIFVAKNRDLVGIIGVGDALKSSAKDAIQKLREFNKLQISLMTGDNKKIAEELAKILRLHNVFADMRPKDKVEAITNQQGQGGKIAYIGDGLTDAESLKKANVGFSINTGIDYSIKTSDITLVNDDLLKINQAFLLAQKSTLKIKNNIIITAIGISLIIILNLLFYLFTKNVFPPHLSITIYILTLVLIEFNNHSFKTFAYSIS